MKKFVTLTTILLSLVMFGLSQTDPSGIQVRIVESTGADGTCTGTSDCANDIGCFSIQMMIDQPGWALSSYNIWVQYDWNPGFLVTNAANHLSDSPCFISDGSDNDDNDMVHWYRVSGAGGSTSDAITANTWTAVHEICFQFSDLNTNGSVLDEIENQNICVGSTGWDGTLSPVTIRSQTVSNLAFTDNNVGPDCLQLTNTSFTCLAATLTGHIYDDVNGNGAQDGGEPDLSGVDVLITDANGDTQTVTTDVNGDWTATSLPPGSTAADVDEGTIPAGATQTEGTDPTSTVAVAGSSVDGGTDGYFVPATLTGHIYDDVNGNGAQDGGEPDLSGVDVLITDANGDTQTVTTDVNGDWTATSLPPGSTAADVDEGTIPAGATQTEGTDPTSTVAVAGSSVDGGTDGYFVPATLTGHIYDDVNGNGAQDGGEPDLSGVDVLITDANGDTQTVTTDVNGDWTATSLPPGSTAADVDEGTIPAGATQTEGTDPTSTVAVAGSSVDGGTDGYFVPATLTGHIYDDVNGNGAQDGGEPDLSGVDVLITDANGDTQTVTTDVNGDWTATSLPPGSTAADVDEGTIPAGATQTEGTDPTSTVAVAGSSVDGGTDGYFVPATLTGHIYDDVNGNGAQDGGEPDLSGVDVLITDANGDTQTVTTDVNGDWTATSLPPGSTAADVDEGTIPAGATQTEGTDPTSTVAVAGSSVDGGTDGYFVPATLTGHIYDDVNGNGAQDGGEPDLSGVDVLITDANGDTQTVTTDVNGDWTATSLPPGSTAADVDEGTIPAGATQTEGTDPTSTVAVAGSSVDGGTDGYQLCGIINTAVFLEGPFDPSFGLMSTILNFYHLLPGMDPALSADIPASLFGIAAPPGQPYTVAPWNYTGTEGDLYGDTILNNIPYDLDITDWVLVSVRETDSLATSTIWKCAALLNSDGVIDFPDTCPCLDLDAALQYYLVIEHRSHLPVMSTILSPVNNQLNFDFRVNQSWIWEVLGTPFGFGQKTVSSIIGDRFVMFAANGDQNPGNSDRRDTNAGDDNVWLNDNGTRWRYIFGDFNMDADANATDNGLWIGNNSTRTFINF